MAPKIDSLQDISERALVEIKSWLEPWFGASKGGSGGGNPNPRIDSTENVGDIWGVHSKEPDGDAEKRGSILFADGADGSFWGPGPTSYREGVLAEDSLRGYWPMGAASGNQPDESGYEHDLLALPGTVTPGTYDVTGGLPAEQDDGAYDFLYNQASVGTIAVPPYLGTIFESAPPGGGFFSNIGNGTDPFTIECLFRRSSGWSLASDFVWFAGTYQRTSGGVTGWALGSIYNGQIILGRASDFLSVGTYVASSFTIDDDTWYHLAGTYDGATLRLYVNGALVASAASAGSITGRNQVTVGGAQHVGGGAGTVGYRYIFGRVDEVAIYNDALSGSTILQHAMNAQLPGGPSIGDFSFYENDAFVANANGLNFVDGTHSTASVTASPGVGVEIQVDVVPDSDATLTFSDITTNNAAVGQHGFLKKLSNVATEFMNGVGNWVGIATVAVTSIKKFGSSALVGDVVLKEGSNVTLTQSGQDITIAATVVGSGAVDSIAVSGDTPMVGDISVVAGSGMTITQDDVDTLTFSAGSNDGWIDDSAHTWTYASASTFTIAGVDLTAVFTKGTRLRFSQTTVKYGVVASSSFSTNTTVTIVVNTDYTIANAAITANSYSYVVSPQGYPGWFLYTPALTASVTNPTLGTGGTISGRFWYAGQMMMVRVSFQFGSASVNAGSGIYSVSLPVNALINEWMGSAWLYDDSASTGRIAMIRGLAGAATTLFWVDSATVSTSNSSPWTWAANDQFHMNVAYRVE